MSGFQMFVPDAAVETRASHSFFEQTQLSKVLNESQILASKPGCGPIPADPSNFGSRQEIYNVKTRNYLLFLLNICCFR